MSIGRLKPGALHSDPKLSTSYLMTKMRTLALWLACVLTLTLSFSRADAQLRCGPTVRLQCGSITEMNPYMGATLGYSTGAIGDLGFAPDREWWGVNVGVNLRILSWLTSGGDSGFVLWDLLSLETDALGKMTSDTLAYYGNGPVQGYERPHQWSWGFGYRLMAGVSSGRVALVGGVRWEDFNHEVGSMVMDGSTLPLAARLAFAPFSVPVIVEGAYSVGGENKMRSVSVDLPFLGRAHIGATYDRVEGMATSSYRVEDLMGDGRVPATWKRLSVSVRVISGAVVGM